MKQAYLFATIRSLIARDALPAALGLLRSLLEHTPRLNDILQQSGRLENIRRAARLGIASHAEARLEENRIRYGVLELLDELERAGTVQEPVENLLALIEHSVGETSDHADTKVLQDELERAVSIVNSKNVVVDSAISAGRDVQIGDKTIQNAEKIYNIGHIDNANFS